MAPTHLTALETDGSDRVRARVLAALHVGRLRPGDRVPSIRRLAGLAGVNHKTVHRAYTALARDGILEVRPGSGTFVADRRSGIEQRPALPALVGALESCRRDAERLRIAPADLARFLSTCLTDGLGSLSVGVVECNLEQITMIGRDLRRATGVQVRPIPLQALERNPDEAAGTISAVVTTDCHRRHVVELLEDRAIPVYSVAFDQRFPRRLLALAPRAEVVMVVHDRHFGPVFLKLLRDLADDPRLLRRIRFIGERRARVALAESRPGTWVYLSPLVAATAARFVPAHVRLIDDEWNVEASALESLRAGLALDSVLAASR